MSNPTNLKLGCDCDRVIAHVGVVVVNYYSYESIRRLLRSLCADQCHYHVTIVIVDNSCDAAEASRLKTLATTFTVVEMKIEIILLANERNLGYGAGANAGVAALPPDIDVIFIANPDTALVAGSLTSAAFQIACHPMTLFATPSGKAEGDLNGLAALRLPWGKSLQLSTGQTAPQRSLIYPAGHFLGVSKLLWDLLNGFSEDFFLYGEEADMVLRARSVGLGEVRTLQGISVSHEQGAATGSTGRVMAKSMVTLRHSCRSSMILFRKHRCIRQYLPAVLLARSGWLIVILVTRGVRPAWAVLDGLIGGLVHQLGPSQRTSYQGGANDGH